MLLKDHAGYTKNGSKRQGNSFISCWDPGKGGGKDGGKGWIGKICRAPSVGSADGLDVGVKKEEGAGPP